MKEGCINKKFREKKRGEFRSREILINSVYRKWLREKGKGKS